VALEKVIAHLEEQLESLRVALDALSYPLLIDKSRTEDVALSGYSGDALTEITHLLGEAIPAANRARQAAKYPVDLDGMRSALVTCQEKVVEVDKRFRNGLMSFENIEALLALKRRRGQWGKWADTVMRGLQETQELLPLAEETIVLIWQEIAERAGTTSVSVQTTNIGQKIIAKTSEVEEMAQKEAT